MAPNEKKPTTLRTPWPPTDHLLKTQPVTGADDWWTLQRTFKRCDVWDIIYYNFATYDPAEVNWYLRERIGCHDVSPTGRNFRFGLLSGGRPMQVYIPTDDWLPPGPQQAAAKQAALDILRDPVASAMAYKAGPLELKPLLRWRRACDRDWENRCRSPSVPGPYRPISLREQQHVAHPVLNVTSARNAGSHGA